MLNPVVLLALVLLWYLKNISLPLFLHFIIYKKKSKKDLELNFRIKKKEKFLTN